MNKTVYYVAEQRATLELTPKELETLKSARKILKKNGLRIAMLAEV